MNSKPLAGFAWLFTAAALSSIGGVCFLWIPLMPLAANGVRCGIAALISLYFLKKDHQRLAFSYSTFFGGLCLALTTQCFSLAVPLTGAGISTLLLNTSPLFVLLFQSVKRKKIPAAHQISCAALVLAGIFVLVKNGQTNGSLLGILFGLCSGACYSGVFFSAQGKSSHAPSAFCIGQLLVFFGSVPFLFSADWHSLTPPSFAALAALGIFQLGLSYRCMAKGLAIASPLAASLICSTEPALAALWAALFAGEHLGISFIMGSAMVLSGIFLQQLLAQHKPKIIGTSAEQITPLNTDSTTVSSSV